MATTNPVAVSGNTYPVKDALKALGGRWNADRKAWMVPAAKADEAQALVAGAPKSTRSSSAARSWNADRFNGYGQRRGGFSRACKTDGNCSSIGSGKSCGGHDCDGF